MPKTTLRESPWRARTPLWNGRNLCSAVEAALVETPRQTSQWCECAHPSSADDSFLVGYPIQLQRPRPRFHWRYRDHPSHRNPRKANACANELSNPSVLPHQSRTRTSRQPLRKSAPRRVSRLLRSAPWPLEQAQQRPACFSITTTLSSTRPVSAVRGRRTVLQSRKTTANPLIRVPASRSQGMHPDDGPSRLTLLSSPVRRDR